LGGRGRRISELEASLVFRESSRTARAIQRDSFWRKKKKERKKERKKEKKESNRKQHIWPGVVTHAFNTRAGKGEASGSL
jgi:ribosomal protein S19